MSLLPLPEELQRYGFSHEAGKISTFIIDEIVSDASYFKFGRHDLDRPSEVVIRGHVYWRPSISWCQPMPKVSVGIPTLYKPIQLQLKIVTTIDLETGEAWVGFYVSVEDICTLKNWENWVYLNLSIRTAYQEKRAKYVQYSPANNCWGWSKCFKVSAMLACKGNPFIIDIALEHNPVPLFLRLPGITTSTVSDHPHNFNDEWNTVSKLQSKMMQDLLLNKGDNSEIIIINSDIQAVASASSSSTTTTTVSTTSTTSASTSLIRTQSALTGKKSKYKRRSKNRESTSSSTSGLSSSRRGYSHSHGRGTNNSNFHNADADNRPIAHNSSSVTFTNRFRSSTHAHAHINSNPDSEASNQPDTGINNSNNNNNYTQRHRRKVRSAV